MEDDLHCNGERPLSAENGEGSKIAPMECEPGCGISIAAKEIPGNGSTVKLQESSENLAKDTYIYRQDIVRCNQDEDMLGVVLEVAGDSDSEGDDVTDVSDTENDEGNSSNDNRGDRGNNENDSGESNESLTDGQVRVMWIDGSETTNNSSDISVVDREFLHGDIVASVSNPTGQLGLVVDVNISVDLVSSTGEMIKNISSRNLKRVRDFTSGDYVVCGPWLGRVDDVVDNVTVLFDDGSLCKVMKADPLRLKPVSKSIIADAGFPYYPGQRVRAVSSSVFKTSRWLSGLWKANRLEGTVTKVQAASVFVYWIASASPGAGDSSAVVPSEEQNPKNLILLTCFTHANWQLGDWCLLPTSQLPLSPSTDTSTIKNAEESSRECRPEIDYSMDHVNDDTKFVTECAEGSDQGFSVPIVDLKDEKESDVTYPSEVVQVGDCKFNHSKPANSLDNLVSSHLDKEFNAISRMTENSKEASACENKVLTCPDRESDSGLAQVANTRNSMIQSGSSGTPAKEHAHESCLAYRKKLRKVLFRREKKAHKKEEPFERSYLIANTMTKVDVAWQDGSRELNVESKSLIPMQSPGDHEFFPEQYVVEKASNESEDAADVKRVGIIRSVDAKERTAHVRWLKPVSRPEDPREFDNDEVVSAYELAEHPDYDYCYGDLVVRLSPISIGADDSISDNPVEREDHVDLPQVTYEMSPEMSTCEMSETLNDEITDTKFSTLSWVGHITGLQDGDIEVTWADGMVSRVGPQAIYVVGREDGESFNGGSEVSDDGASWETVEENEMGTLDVAEGADLQPPTDNVVEKNTYTAGPSEDSNPVRNESLSIPLAALGFFTRLATGFFSRGKKEMDSSYTDEDGMKQTESQDMQESYMRDTVVDEHSSQESDVLDDLSAQTSQETGQVTSTIAVAAETEEKVEDNLHNHTSEEMDVDSGCQRASNEHGSCSFKHFDIAKDPFDHHFLSENGQNSYGRKWIKKVQKEWSILEKNLPDAVFVRVFEDRMDLLRAVIVGACGTPYQDGLFFFDFNLPIEYPQVPPSVYYHSGGLRINPNLYEEGKVCLSLLNTWTGKGNEVWDPNSSSILQVLVSIQGLVLNSRPYFNEAGYEKQVGTAEGEKNSLPYNENTYLLNLRSMLYLLRRPPMHFEDFVKDHFRRRGYYILKACDAYMKGCPVGSLSKDACMTGENNEQSSSVGFKLMLAKILPKIYVAFSEVGAECQEFEHLLKS